MKLLVIPDIHGRDYWKEIVEKESNADVIVFLGDYFDSWNIKANVQIDNFEEICKFKIESEENAKKVILLIGNHDLSYYPGVAQFCQTSGYQAGASSAIEASLNKYKDLLQMCYIYDKYLFIHAGVSYTWLRMMQYKNDDVEKFVNDMWQYKPINFVFNGVHPNGDDVYQTPVWIRPGSLMKANKTSFLKDKYIQIVGHTAQDKIDIKGYSTGGRYYFVDTFNTSKDYITINNGRVKLNKC